MTKNIDPKTVKSFGDEWSRFDQSSMSEPIYNSPYAQ